MKRFIILFLILLVSLFSIEMLQPVQAHVIQPFTMGLARLSAALITPFDPNVVAYGRIIEHTVSRFAVSIEAGCNGVEAAIVLIAAVIAFPASWKQKFTAMVLGFVTIQVLNIGRIISLFYLGQWDLSVFTFTHLYLWPVLIMLDVLVVFLIYLRLIERRGAGVPA